MWDGAGTGAGGRAARGRGLRGSLEASGSKLSRLCSSTVAGAPH